MLETLRSLPSTGDAMSLPQLRTLISLATEGPQTIESLAEGLELHESAIEALCAVLATRGFVVRIPSPSGAIVVALSTGGRRRIDDVISHDVRAAARSPATQVLPTMCLLMPQEEP